MPTPFERNRMENIKRNQELLFSMDLDELKSYAPKKTETKDVAPAVKSRKRKSPPPSSVEEEEEEEEFGAKLVKTRATQDITNASGVRGGARNAGKTVDHKSEVVKTLPEVISTAARVAMNSEKKARSGRRYAQNSTATFLTSKLVDGGRPGNHAAQTLYMSELGIVPAKSPRWSPESLREQMGPIRSASGGYKADVDEGHGSTYTSSGRRGLKGTKDAPKNSSDQTSENNFNKAFKVSADTKNPIRVVRGFKNRSQYGSEEGCRYDGLYQVITAWTEPGLNPEEYLVCKHIFKRLPDQPQIPTRALDDGSITSDGEYEEDRDATGDED